MTTRNSFPNYGLDDLRRLFPCGAAWPPRAAALAALLDLGLTVPLIARYFRASQEDVTQLCDRYGLLPVRDRESGDAGR